MDLLRQTEISRPSVLSWVAVKGKECRVRGGSGRRDLHTVAFGNLLFGNLLFGNLLFGNLLLGNLLFGNLLFGNLLFGNLAG